MSKNDSRGNLDFVGTFYGLLKQQYRTAVVAWINLLRDAGGLSALDYPPVGATQHEEVWCQGQARLLRYGGPGPRRAPLLIVPSLINRHYILDLLPGRSVIERLREGGLDVYLLDWGVAAPADRDRGLADYALELLPRAAAQVAPAPHVLGYCMGGTLALGAIARGRLRARTFVALATPVDCHDGGTLSTWARADGIRARELVEAFGNVPDYVLQPAFKLLDPVGLAQKFVHVRKKIDDTEFCRFFLAMETWLEDNVPFPGRAFEEWIEDVYRENGLLTGHWRLGGARVELSRVRCPILDIMAEGDYICPPRSSEALLEQVGSTDKQRLLMPGGHIGLSTGTAAHKKLWPRVARWLLARSQATAQPVRRAARRVRRPRGRK